MADDWVILVGNLYNLLYNDNIPEQFKETIRKNLKESEKKWLEIRKDIEELPPENMQVIQEQNQYLNTVPQVDCYIELLGSIVKQAVSDIKTFRKRKLKDLDPEGAMKFLMVDDWLELFLSQWSFDLDIDYLRSMLGKAMHYQYRKQVSDPKNTDKIVNDKT